MQEPFRSTLIERLKRNSTSHAGFLGTKRSGDFLLLFFLFLPSPRGSFQQVALAFETVVPPFRWRSAPFAFWTNDE